MAGTIARAVSGASLFARAGHETDSTDAVGATVLLVLGTLMLVFRRYVFEAAASIFGRGKLRKLYDLETKSGRRTLLISFTLIPAVFVIGGAFGLVTAL